MAITQTQKNEMDALYQTVKEMSEMQLKLMRIYAQKLRDLEATTNAELLCQGNVLVQGSTLIH